jgi:hypothetical protein
MQAPIVTTRHFRQSYDSKVIHVLLGLQVNEIVVNVLVVNI